MNLALNLASLLELAPEIGSLCQQGYKQLEAGIIGTFRLTQSSYPFLTWQVEKVPAGL